MRSAMSSGADSPPLVMRGPLAAAPSPPNPAAPMPVRMKEGQTSVTPTPESSTSLLRLSKNPCSACLLAE
jgi:hypothetical protein